MSDTEYKVPTDLQYTKSHEWVKEEDGVYTVGLTDFAQDHMGDIVYIDLPDVDDDVELEDSFAEAESVKAVSEIFSPVAGTVREINEDIDDDPAVVNQDPYGNWLVKVEGEPGELMNAEEYIAFCETEDI
ncbi:MAG: glycine cleavage system protein GcvH [Actinomycetaceae bacterium]|nr:glycine cleavage system protein GcvH [Actinomycetaceae bacterium]MDY6082736.1 glycine cleavage system protein GcvH [Actinomycetaceae bacterium]